MSFNESVDFTKDKGTDQEIRHKDDFVQQLTMRTSEVEHKRYGKMLVLLETDRLLITLGPDYICFIVAFVCFAVAGFFLTSFVNRAFEKLWVKALNILIVIIQQLSYLMVGLSNPGVVLQQNLASQQTVEQESQQTKRYCQKCKIKMFKNMHHCKRCDVCIRGYDHHCPWVSKCIGATNIKRFYFFVSFTPLYLVYFMIMLLISSAVNYANQNLKP